MTDPIGAAPPGPSSRDDVGPSFRWAWDAFRLHWGAWVPLSAVLVVVGWTLYFVAYVPIADAVTDGAVNALGFYRQTTEAEPSLSEALAPLKLLPVSFGFMFVLSAVLGPLASGFTRMGLAVADGGTVSARDLLHFPRGVLPTWTLGLLLAAGSSLGLLLCYVPGLAFSVLSCFSFHFFYDRGLSPVASVKASFTLVRQHPGVSILAVMLCTLIGLAGVLACLVGTIVSAPLAQLFLVHRYRAISGGRVAPTDVPSR